MRSRKWMHQVKPDGLLRVTLVLLIFAIPQAWAGDWRSHESTMDSLNSRIENTENEITSLIAEKKRVSDPKELSRILGELQTKHKELSEAAEEHRKERLHLRFKHPEKGDTEKRKYPRYSVKSLEDMEVEIGLDGRLDRVKMRIERVYNAQFKKVGDPSAAGNRNPASSGELERIRLRK